MYRLERYYAEYGHHTNRTDAVLGDWLFRDVNLSISRGMSSSFAAVHHADLIPLKVMGYKKAISFAVNRPEWYIHQPLGTIYFPKEILPIPSSWAAQTGNLRWTSRRHDRGGHFAALERPEIVAQDIQDCFGQIWELRDRNTERDSRL